MTKFQQQWKAHLEREAAIQEWVWICKVVCFLGPLVGLSTAVVLICVKAAAL